MMTKYDTQLHMAKKTLHVLHNHTDEKKKFLFMPSGAFEISPAFHILVKI